MATGPLGAPPTLATQLSEALRSAFPAGFLSPGMATPKSGREYRVPLAPGAMAESGYLLLSIYFLCRLYR